MIRYFIDATGYQGLRKITGSEKVGYLDDEGRK